MPDGNPWVVDVTTSSFPVEVLDRSRTAPVVVDFWAPWCGPCKILAPVLESLAAEYGGRFRLAKVNTEENHQLAYEFGVQSIPYVVAIRDGAMVDAFRGALPEPQVRQWIERILPSPAETLCREAAALEESDPAGAQSRLRQALELQPELPAARIALARVLLRTGQTDEARSLLEALERRGFLEAEAQRVKAELEVVSVARESGGVEAARASAAANPDELGLQVRLAEALAAARQFREALDVCLGVIQRDKLGVGVQAKDAMLSILNLASDDAELAGEYRRKLASALY
jgi:putative thioredoxin